MVIKSREDGVGIVGDYAIVHTRLRVQSGSVLIKEKEQPIKSIILQLES